MGTVQRAKIEIVQALYREKVTDLLHYKISPQKESPSTGIFGSALLKARFCATHSLYVTTSSYCCHCLQYVTIFDVEQILLIAHYILCFVQQKCTRGWSLALNGNISSNSTLVSFS